MSTREMTLKLICSRRISPNCKYRHHQARETAAPALKLLHQLRLLLRNMRAWRLLILQKWLLKRQAERPQHKMWRVLLRRLLRLRHQWRRAWKESG